MRNLRRRRYTVKAQGFVAFAAKPWDNRIIAHETLKELHSSTSIAPNLI